DRADDLVDFNFLKVQTDIYRVRQLVLGSTAATRLAVSPALAGIAQAETAAASTERIAGFYSELKQASVPIQARAAEAAPAPRAVNLASGVSAVAPGGSRIVDSGTKPVGVGVDVVLDSRFVRPELE